MSITPTIRPSDPMPPPMPVVSFAQGIGIGINSDNQILQSSPSTDAASQKGVVLYDGLCPLCQKSVRILTKLDWLGRLEFRDARMPAGWPSSAESLSMDRLLEEMHVVTPNRKKAHAGFRAFRWIARQLPLLWPGVPFMYLPGVPYLGRKAYLWIAKNRYQLVPCHDGVCQLPRKA